MVCCVGLYFSLVWRSVGLVCKLDTTFVNWCERGWVTTYVAYIIYGSNPRIYYQCMVALELAVDCTGLSCRLYWKSNIRVRVGLGNNLNR